MIFTIGLSVVALFGISFAGSFAGRITAWPVGGELGKMVGWGDFAAKVRGIAAANKLDTVVFIGRGLTASMLYEMRGSGLDVRAYLGDGMAPADHFEMTRPWRPVDRGPVLLVYAGTFQPPGAVRKRAVLIEQFKTDVFIAKGDWTASAYRID
jgi:hypothetical protein